MLNATPDHLRIYDLEVHSITPDLFLLFKIDQYEDIQASFQYCERDDKLFLQLLSYHLIVDSLEERSLIPIRYFLGLISLTLTIPKVESH